MSEPSTNSVIESAVIPGLPIVILKAFPVTLRVTFPSLPEAEMGSAAKESNPTNLYNP